LFPVHRPLFIRRAQGSKGWRSDVRIDDGLVNDSDRMPVEATASLADAQIHIEARERVAIAAQPGAAATPPPPALPNAPDSRRIILFPPPSSDC